MLVPCSCQWSCGRAVEWFGVGRMPVHPICRRKRRAIAQAQRDRARTFARQAVDIPAERIDEIYRGWLAVLAYRRRTGVAA